MRKRKHIPMVEVLQYITSSWPLEDRKGTLNTWRKHVDCFKHKNTFYVAYFSNSTVIVRKNQTLFEISNGTIKTFNVFFFENFTVTVQIVRTNFISHLEVLIKLDQCNKEFCIESHAQAVSVLFPKQFISDNIS